MNSILLPYRTTCARAIPYLVFLFVLLLFSTSAFCSENTGAPKILREWIPWVLHNLEDKTCTLRSDDTTRRYCSWPSSLNIELYDSMAVFNQKWLIETASLVPLPGSRKLWPEAVKDGKTPLIVLDHNGTPSVRLQPGKHILSGRFNWTQLPDSISLPASIGLINLKNKTAIINKPFIDKEGTLWLKTHENKATKETDQASLQVFRKILDTIPLQEELHIVLTVSGTPREIPLGLMIPHDFLPLRITTPLPSRIDHLGRIVVQARPGQWMIDMAIRNTDPIPTKKLGIGPVDGLWPENEIWSFQSFPTLRRVHVENVRSIDPSRTGLPGDWLNLPAYFMGRHDIMRIVEKERGNPQTTPDNLTLTRTLWLDQKGDGLTAFDRISGTMSKGWRLNVVRQLHLGKVDIDGKSQLITKLPDSDLVGVEVRKGKISLNADSRIEQPVHTMSLSFPALGWDHTFQHLSATLNLPPGWKLLTSSGIDKVPTWLNRWTLLDIFLVLITCLGTGKLFGRRWGLAMLFTLILIYHQPQAPRYHWLPLLALFAIGNMITSKKAIFFIKIPYAILLLLLVLQCVPFMVREIRVGIFPQLEFGPYYKVTTNRQPNALDAVSSLSDQKNELKRFAPPTAAKMLRLRAMAPSEKLTSLQADKELQYDPQAMIQTGPGLPLWHWRTIPLTWNGPVNPQQMVDLILLPPWVNCVLAFIRVVLLGLLVIGFLLKSSSVPTIKSTSAFPHIRNLFSVLFFIMVFSGIPTMANAELPNQEMLQELQHRLLASSACGNECSSLESCLLTNNKENLFLDLEVHAANDTAVPLPGDRRTFSAVLVDNKPTEGLQLDNNTLLIRLSAGIHHIILEKDLTNLNHFNLSFPLLPHRAKANLSGWNVTGIHSDQTMEKQISITRIDAENTSQSKPEPKSGTDEVSLPPFFHVIRTVHFGLKWTVDTRIERKTQGNAITANIPLIQGETPTSESLFISKNKVQVNLGPQDTTFSWHSALPQKNLLTLSAAKTSNWVETWFLDISPIWHIAFTGIPEVSQTNPAGLRFPEFHPYPGESLTMSISRPPGVAGPTMTIDSSTLKVHPGARATDCTLSLSLHTSRGMEHTIALPQNIELLKVLINNKEYQLPLSDGHLTLPIQPGKEKIDIRWLSKEGMQIRTSSPFVDLDSPSVNATIHMDVPLSRWILFTGGPRTGPAVLFWGEIVIIIFIAFLLGRTRLVPLSTVQWMLLGIGLSQVNIVYGALVVGWLFLLGVRKEKGSALSSPAGFNLLQISLVLLTILAFFSLLYAVQKGLLGYPDMQIGGNGSYGHALTWYQDRNLPILPRAWVVSFPLFVYRCLMLAWALWLAYSLLKWLNWGWACFTTGNIWRTKIQQPDEQKQSAKEEKNQSQAIDSSIELKSEQQEEPISYPKGSGGSKKSRFHLFLQKIKKK